MPQTDITEKNNTTLVIGGGVAGIQVSLDLAKAGRKVAIIDKGVSIGGLITQLDRTFPTNNCDLCVLAPNLSESDRRDHIDLFTMTELESLKGEPGNFDVVLKTKPRYIDVSKCTACGDCHKYFSECVRFTPGLSHEAPACMRYPQATAQAYSIDIEKCRDMDALAACCTAKAIIPDDTQSLTSIHVGAVVIATGAELFNARDLTHFGGGAYPNVVSGLEYERIMSASGPTSGELLRPSDGKAPKKIAWIQCAGSRGINKNDVSYCSSVCCMYALKEAIVTKERFKEDIETTIFYMDMRTSGKDYELYRHRAEHEHHVKLIQSRPHSIMEKNGTNDLNLSFIVGDQSVLQTETFDMVVLSTGFRIPKQMDEMAEKLGIRLNRHHFVESKEFSPVETSRPGIYVCGVAEGPKDIPETMIQSSAAVSLACRDTERVDEKTTDSDDSDGMAPERDTQGEAPRVGVFICDCGLNIGGVIDVEKIAAQAAGLPDVIASETVGHGCGVESMARIQSVIQAQGINRVVIAGCSPRTHEGTFQNVIQKAGLNRNLLEMANIRDQNTWVHSDQKEAAALKAMDLIRMAVARVEWRRPLMDHLIPIHKKILVVGGGVAGMTAALTLAEQGFKTYIVEQSPNLGGLAKGIRKTLSGQDVQIWLTDLTEQTTRHPDIEVITDATIVDHNGMPGMFVTGVQVAPGMSYRQIEHGVTIMTTGATQSRPKEYLLGEHPAVVTQYDMDSIIEDDPQRVKRWENVVMIQCVGSRSEKNPNCSRICCGAAIKNALRIVEKNPDAQIYVFHRDIRTLGFQEDEYLKAREKGIIFFRYDLDRVPQVEPNGEGLIITGRDHVLGRTIEIEADCLTLSAGMLADDESTEDMAVIFNLNRTEDGYFLEDHVKWRPSDLSIPGFMTAGAAHGPKTIRETVAQAQAAAGRALTFLSSHQINLGSNFARVDSEKCASCLVCVRACPYQVPFINSDGHSEIDPAQCHGCGICASECPAKAIRLTQCGDDMISAEINELFKQGTR